LENNIMPRYAAMLQMLDCDTLMCHNVIMPSVNIRQLRDTKRLKAWLRAGKTVELREREKLIARIVPEKEEKPAPEWPDFEARRKEMFGDRIFPNVVLEDRGRY
jgi:antitoxin (DNA-binding transcriptional repressor) of toxin-antitoxin stability system